LIPTDEVSRVTAVPAAEIKDNWPPSAYKFVLLFAQVERRLKDAGKLKQGKKVAEADWSAFALSLPSDFFGRVLASGRAQNLINEPPRTRTPTGRVFTPQTRPLGDVVGLFVQGVCRVRNNLVHGEKFGSIGPESDRDEALTQEAYWVLEQAIGLTRSPI
jgi:hypothetical protein